MQENQQSKRRMNLTYRDWIKKTQISNDSTDQTYTQKTDQINL